MTPISKISGNAMLLSFILACSGCCMGEPSGAGYRVPAPLFAAVMDFPGLLGLVIYMLIGLALALGFILMEIARGERPEAVPWSEDVVGLLIMVAVWPLVLGAMALFAWRGK